MKHKHLCSFLSFVFFLSGATSLIYQVIWQRLMALHYGLGVLPSAMVVTFFLLGLGIGASLGGYLADKTTRRLRIFAIAEFAVGMYGMISPRLFHAVSDASVKYPVGITLISMALLLIPPTVFMGLSFPLLTKHFNLSGKSYADTVSRLYRINTAGAATGAFAAAYVFMSFWSISTTLQVSASINILLGSVVLLSNRIFHSETSPDNKSEPIDSVDMHSEKMGFLSISLLAFLSGYIALTYEIFWFRVLSVILKSSPYVFATVLAIYLAATTRGASKAIRSTLLPVSRQRQRLADLFIRTGIYSTASILFYIFAIQYTPIREFARVSFMNALHPAIFTPQENSGTFLGLCANLDVLIWTLFFVYYPAVCMGESFVLIASLARRTRDTEGRAIGMVLTGNLAGNVIGGLSAAILLLEALGSERLVMLLAGLGIVGGLIISSRKLKRTLLMSGYMLLVFFLFPDRGQMYEIMHSWFGPNFSTYIDEGPEAVIVTMERPGNLLNFINGQHNGGKNYYIYHQMTLEALGYAKKSSDTLVIGYGTGTIAEILLATPELGTVTIVELSETLIRNLHKIHLFDGLLDHPRINLILDDGRRFCKKTSNNFDLVLMDTVRPFDAYSTNLLSLEFMHLLSSRMTDNGILMLWANEHRIIPKTLATVFPHVRQYEEFCIAGKSPLIKDESRIESILNNLQLHVRHGVNERRNTYLGDSSFILNRSAEYPVISDFHPVCEYFLGLQVNNQLDYTPEYLSLP